MPNLEILSLGDSQILQRISLSNLPKLKLILMPPSLSSKLLMDEYTSKVHSKEAEESLFGNHSYTKTYKDEYKG